MYNYMSIYKDLQEILFRKKQIVEKYVSYDTIYIKTNNKYYPVFVHTQRIIHIITLNKVVFYYNDILL